MLERMEGVRLFNWNQLTNASMIPSTFTSYYYPLATSNGNEGITYSGTMSIGSASNLSPSVGYAANLRSIDVTLVWTNGGHQRVRTMSTIVAQNGIQNYVFTH